MEFLAIGCDFELATSISLPPFKSSLPKDSSSAGPPCSQQLLLQTALLLPANRHVRLLVVGTKTKKASLQDHSVGITELVMSDLSAQFLASVSTLAPLEDKSGLSQSSCPLRRSSSNRCFSASGVSNSQNYETGADLAELPMQDGGS